MAGLGGQVKLAALRRERFTERLYEPPSNERILRRGKCHAESGQRS